MRNLRIIFLSSFILLTFFGLTSCQQNYGNRLESNELDVYYSHNQDEELARKVAVYWKENDFLTQTKQTLRLNREGDVVHFQLLVSDKESIKELSFDERKQLLGLQKDVQRKAFGDTQVELVICDNQFVELYNINN
ncbi:MAG: hypothetical protein ACI9G9_000606 [Psychromonas sp.]|jgi:hypothetical protein